MLSDSHRRRWQPALALLAVVAICAVPDTVHARAKLDRLPPSTRLALDNDFEAILIPNRAVPLVTSVVVVRTGSSRETPSVNGLSHMLEHLLFNGTIRRTQEQLEDEMARQGIISNAQTGRGHTSFFVVAPSGRAAKALDLQADMLFGSTFPQEKLEKERGIILNEIARDRESGATTMSELYAGRLYHPGGLALPVTGTPESVKGISRQAILDYYRAWYVPNNMTAIVMGDFEPKEIEALLQRYFGAAAPGLLTVPATGTVNLAALGLSHSRLSAGTERLLWLGAPAPAIDASIPFDATRLLAGLLEENLARSVNARLSAAGAAGTVLEANVDLDAYREASTIQVRAALDPIAPWAQTSKALLDEIRARLAAAEWRTADLDRARLAQKASLMRLWEKPHYFGLDRAPYVAAMGWEPTRDIVRRLSFVEAADLKALARDLADPKRWATFAAGPDAPPDAGAVSVAGAAPGPASLAEEHPTPESRAAVERWKGPRSPEREPEPSMPPREAAERPDAPVNVRAVLPNGLQISLDSSEDSRVFAAHVLVKNRAAAEPSGKSGIAELLHRLAGAGTRRHPGPALDAALAAIGGSLKVADDPDIPYDDIYLSPEYSYIRLESLDEFAVEALGLLSEILSEPVLDDSAAFVAAREALVARAIKAQSSARERCRQLLARGLWGAEQPFARPLFGVEEEIRSITAADLVSFHAAYFHPRNLIVAIGSSIRPERLLPDLEAKLGRWTTTAARPPKAAATRDQIGAGVTVEGPRLQTLEIGSDQVYLMWGRLAPQGPVALAAYQALAAVLTRRMVAELREAEGLAYSLGAEASLLGGRTQFVVMMGTLPERADHARARLKEVILSLAASPPSSQEVETTARAAEARLLMRSLSRINRAFGRCLEEMRRTRPAPLTESTSSRETVVSADQVAAAARQLIDSSELTGWEEAVVRPPQVETTR